MKTTHHYGLGAGGVALLGLALTLGSLHTARGGKPPKDPPPPSSTAFYNVIVDEIGDEGQQLPPEEWVFWGHQDDVIGRIQSDDPEDPILINQLVGGGAPPALHFGNLVVDQACAGASNAEDFLTCFPPETWEQYRTVLIGLNDNPEQPEPWTVTVNWQALNTRGASQYYNWKISAQPVVSCSDLTPVALGSFLDLSEPGDYAVLRLIDFEIVPGTGKSKKACKACGGFAGEVFMTVIRRAGPL